MQNIIELGSGRCEMFNENTHLNVNNLKKYINRYLFIEIVEKSSVKLLNNQKKLSGILEG